MMPNAAPATATDVLTPATQALLVAAIKGSILRRRQECYGALAITDAQADELARAIVMGPVSLLADDAYLSGYNAAVAELIERGTMRPMPVDEALELAETAHVR